MMPAMEGNLSPVSAGVKKLGAASVFATFLRTPDIPILLVIFLFADSMGSGSFGLIGDWYHQVQ